MTLQDLRGFEEALRSLPRRTLEDEIERLIAMVDSMDIDPDLELTGDEEASLGWTERGPGTAYYDPGDDRERDESDWEPSALERHGKGFYASGADDSEDSHDAEPWLGNGGVWIDGMQYDLEKDDSASEPSLGWPEQIDQLRRLKVKEGWFCEDGEEECEDEGAQCDDEGALDLH